MEEERKLKQKIAMLQDEHRGLDLRISSNIPAINMLELQRLKKHKLALKDEISRLSSFLYPDIIA